MPKKDSIDKKIEEFEEWLWKQDRQNWEIQRYFEQDLIDTRNEALIEGYEDGYKIGYVDGIDGKDSNPYKQLMTKR